MMSETFERAVRKEQAVLKLLYAEPRLRVGEKAIDYSMEAFAGRTDLKVNVVAKFMPILYKLGILEKEGPYYGSKANGLPGGRHYNYTILVPYDEALDRLVKDQAERDAAATTNRKAGAKRGARKRTETGTAAFRKRLAENAGRLPDETVAIVGPDADDGLAAKVPAAQLRKLAETRKDEPAALVEAARQYVARPKSNINAMLADLEAEAEKLGITFDREQFLRDWPGFADATESETDERLEAIALVLPYIDALERRSEHFEKMFRATGASTSITTMDTTTFPSTH